VQPVRAAARDIGFVGFRSEGYTLDLSGQVSQAALDQLRAPDAPADWVDALVKENEIQLVLVPAQWGEEHAGPDWVKIASLSLTGSRITAPAETVAFYSVGPGNAERANSVLVDFHRGLPQSQDLLGPDGSVLPRPEPLPEPVEDEEGEGEADADADEAGTGESDDSPAPADPNAPEQVAPPAEPEAETPPVGSRRRLPSPSAVAVDRRGGEGG